MRKQFQAIDQPSTIKNTIDRLAKSDYVRVVSRWAYPEEPDGYLSNKISSVSTVDAFQHDVMIPLAHVVLKRTSQGLSFSGLENLAQTPTLFISNHRDIVLDAYFLQVILLENCFETSQIIAGTNLYVNDFVADIAAINKIIAIGRGGSKRGFGEEMINISTLLRRSLTAADGNGSSVWIAQRNGRTKDRVDKTDPSIIHMLCTTGAISEYRIVPLTITYEIEPNADYKARHLWQLDHPDAAVEENYMQQMLSSILQQKGHIHYAFHPPISLDADMPVSKEYYQSIAQRVDEDILGGYRQWAKSEVVEQQWQAMVASADDEIRPYMALFNPRYLV